MHVFYKQYEHKLMVPFLTSLNIINQYNKHTITSKVGFSSAVSLQLEKINNGYKFT